MGGWVGRWVTYDAAFLDGGQGRDDWGADGDVGAGAWGGWVGWEGGWVGGWVGG